MKKLIMVLLFALVTMVSFGQEKVEQYCEVVAVKKLFSQKVNITVDYGEESNTWHNTTFIKNSDGKLKTFNSVMDALNYMSKNGWVFVNVLLLSESSGPNVYHYILKKEFEKSEIDKTN